RKPGTDHIFQTAKWSSAALLDPFRSLENVVCPRFSFPGGGELAPVGRVLGGDEGAQHLDLARVGVGGEESADQLEALEERVGVGDVGLAVVADGLDAPFLPCA